MTGPEPGPDAGTDPDPRPHPRPGPDLGPGSALDPDLASAEPDRRGRRPGRIVAYGVLALCLVALVVLALGRVWGTTLLDPRAVERDVAEQFEQRYAVDVEVDCPAEMEVEVGRDHRCDAETGARERLTVVITVTDDDPPAYTWDVD